MRNPTACRRRPNPHPGSSRRRASGRSAAEAPKPAPRRPAVALAPVTVSDALPFRIILTADVPSDAPEGQALRFTVVDGLAGE